MWMEELPQLEKLFELNIYVYKFTKVGDKENKKKTVQRSHRRYSNAVCAWTYTENILLHQEVANLFKVVLLLQVR